MAVAPPAPTTTATCAPRCSTCAERALSEGGLAQLSLRELARQVGVSHAAPRRHFADKQALLDALAQDGFERLGRDAARGASTPPARTSTPAWPRLARAYVRFATAPRRAARADVRRQAPPGRGRQPARGRRRGLRRPAGADRRGPGRRRGGRRRPRGVATVAWAAVQGLAAHRQRRHARRRRARRPRGRARSSASSSACGRGSRAQGSSTTRSPSGVRSSSRAPRAAQHHGVEARPLGRLGIGAARVPGVGADVVVIAVGGQEGGLSRPAGHELEADLLRPEAPGRLDVGDLEVHVADAHAARRRPRPPPPARRRSSGSVSILTRSPGPGGGHASRGRSR